MEINLDVVLFLRLTIANTLLFSRPVNVLDLNFRPEVAAKVIMCFIVNKVMFINAVDENILPINIINRNFHPYFVRNLVFELYIKWY